jgi:hypothetical protein
VVFRRQYAQALQTAQLLRDNQAVQKPTIPRGELMKLASFLTWQNWALLGMNLAVESLIVFLSIKRNFYKRLFMLTVLAGYCVLIDIAFIVLALAVNVDSFSGNMYYSRVSWNFYWLSQVAASLLILLLSVQIAIETLKLDYVTALWGMITATLLILATGILIPGIVLGNMLMLVSIGDVLAGLALLIIGALPRTQWPRGFPLVVTGIVLSVLLHALCSIGSVYWRMLTPLFNIGAPVSSLLGMIIFALAVYRYKEQDPAPTT